MKLFYFNFSLISSKPRRTPDGWTKITSTVQYDEPTRRLWEELQKPYGNQSSFLRHLLLLEKYFRNGDLLLAQNANANAIVYTESVQHRLQAYDNIPPRPISITQLQPQNSVTTANKAITISKVSNTPATATVAPKPIVPAVTLTPKQTDTSNSLLKSNAATAPRSRNYSVTTEPINGDKANIVSNKTDLIRLNNATIQQGNTSTPKNKSIGLPPELICINSPLAADKPNDKQIAGIPPSYQLQMQLTLQQQIQQQHQNSLLLPQQTKQMIQSMVPPAVQSVPTNQSPSKKQTTNTPNTATATKSPPNNPNSVAGNKSNVIRLPETLTDAERRESKQWRPTLMPITVEKNNTNTEIYQTADGRRLPYLVQVQSGGKPYMISIHDYNRMCILRRERLLRDQTELIKNKSNQSSGGSSGGGTAPKTTASNSMMTNQKVLNTVVDVDKLTKSQNQIPIPKVQIPNKVLEAIPIKPNENLTTTIAAAAAAAASDSLLKRNKNQSSLLKSNAIPTTNQAKIMPQPNKLPLSLTNALSQSNVVSITSTPSISAILAMTSSTPALTPPPIQLIPNSQPITITNYSSGPSSSVTQANVSALEALFKTTNQVTTTPSTMLQWAEQLNKSNSGNVIGITPIDNSASSILSKIPKSLTVIPQQKRLSKSGDD